MTRAIKIYLVRLKEIFQNIGSFPYTFILNHLKFWIFSLRVNLKISNELYERKHNIYILKWVEAKYGNLFPSKFPQSQHTKINTIKELPIWVCWLQGEKNMPELIQLCYNSIKRNANGRPVKFISSDNIEEYIEIPAFLKEKLKKGFIGYANYTDVLRLMLLYKYGGTWIDSTIYLSDKLDDSWRNPLFSSIKLNTQNRQYTISQYKWATFYLFAYPQSPAIKCFMDILLTYWKDDHKKIIDYFLIDYVFEILYRKNFEFKKCIDSTPYNQEQVYDLQKKLNSPYQKIKLFNKSTYIYKLNRKAQIKSGNTIYQYLKNIK